MKRVLLTSLLFTCLLSHPAQAGELDRLRKVIEKKDYEISQLRLELDLLHRQLAEEQPRGTAPKALATALPSRPAPTNSTKGSKSTTHRLHTVVRGDTLSGIARQHRTSVKALRSANQLTGNLIRVGQKLNVPSADKQSPQQTQVSQAQLPKPDQTKPKSASLARTEAPSYVIKAGDTFHSIAQAQGCTVASLRTANPELNPTRLRIGQKIQLSAPPKSSKVELKELPQERLITEGQASQKEADSTAPKTKQVVEVEITEDIIFEEFAKQQGMSIKRLNELNGYDLDADELIAATSIFYVER